MRGAKDLEFIENGKGLLILFFILFLAQQIIRAPRRIGRFVLSSRKNNQEGWMESEAQLEPSRTSTMKFTSFSLHYKFIQSKTKKINYFQLPQKKSIFLSSRKEPYVSSDYNFQFCVKVKISNHAFKQTRIDNREM